MVHPELRHLLSPDLAPPTMPINPADCAVPFQALIGPRGAEGAEAFGFTAVTPAYLRRSVGPTWGRGYLILEEFSWETMTQALALLLAHCVRPTCHCVRSSPLRARARRARRVGACWPRLPGCAG